MINNIVCMIPQGLGLFISFSLLRVTDLTMDGSFVAAAGVYARLLTAGNGHILSGLAGIVVSMIIGIFTAALQAKQRITPLLASILVLFMLQSLNFLLMGRPNISLLQVRNPNTQVYIGIVFTLSCILIMVTKSRLGLLIKACGLNPKLIERLNLSSTALLMLGLGASNALAGLSGILASNVVGYADLTMGMGTTLTILGASMIGNYVMSFASLQLSSDIKQIVGVIIGIFCYMLLMMFLLRVHIDPLYLKLVLSMVLIVMIIVLKQHEVNS